MVGGLVGGSVTTSSLERLLGNLGVNDSNSLLVSCLESPFQEANLVILESSLRNSSSLLQIL